VWVDAIDHEGSDDTWSVELTGITCRFQIVEDLFVYGTEMLAVGYPVAINFVDLIDHLPQELAGFQVVVSVREHDTAAAAVLSDTLKSSMSRKAHHG